MSGELPDWSCAFGLPQWSSHEDSTVMIMALKKKKILLITFIFGCAGSSWLLAGSSLVASGRDYSSVALHRLLTATASCCGEQALGHVGSVVAALGLLITGLIAVVHGLSCPMPCGIFSDRGSNSCLLRWQADSLPLSHQGSPEMGIGLMLRELRSHMPCWCGQQQRKELQLLIERCL